MVDPSGRAYPRRLAPVVIGAADIANGVALTVDRSARQVPAYGHVVTTMPLDVWGLTFVAVGIAAIVSGFLRSHRLSYAAAFCGVLLWSWWALLIVPTVSLPTVSLRAVVSPVGLAAVHSLLVPYRRR